MELRQSEYIDICTDFLKGSYGNSLPEGLKSAFLEIQQDFSPDEIARMQSEALKNVLVPYDKDLSVIDRFTMLTQHRNACCESFIAGKEPGSDFQLSEEAANGLLAVPHLRRYIEETHFMIKTLSEITETLDNSVSRLAPCEKQLYRLEQISHTIIQNADFGVIAVDCSYKITMFNKAASIILGIPENVTEKSFDEVFSEMSEESYTFLRNCLFVQGSSRKELKINGKKKILEIVANVLFSLNDEPTGAVLLIYDITAKEQEKMVLEESIKLAAIGKLAAGVAHEVKNPLTVIKGFSQLMLSKNYDSARTANYLRLICQEVDRANHFIQDFLNLGKPQKPQRRIVDVYNIIEDTVLLIQSQCFLNRVEIIQNVDCSAKIFADPDQMKQVLINLVKNSLEAMEDSSNKKILAISVSKDTTSRTVNISVTDTGCGIPEEIIDRVTTSFFTTKKFGTGLGLNISRAIIEQHEGELKFFSGQGGTTAVIHLPLYVGNA